MADMPELGTANELINQRTQAAMELDGGWDKKDNSGLMQKQPEYMGDVGQLAVQRRAEGLMAPQYQQLQAEQKLQDQTNAFSQLHSALGDETQRLRLQYAKEYAQKKRKAQEDAMRAQTIGQVLGLAGFAVGTYLGGPVGGAAGASAGQAIGGSTGG